MGNRRRRIHSVPTGSLKIALFHLGFFYSGGGEKLVIEEMRGLRALGHEVDCYAPYVDREGCFPDLAEMHDVKVILPPPPRWLPMRHPLWVVLSCALIPFLVWQFRKYDVFFGANQPGPWFAFVVSRLLRKPYVIYLAQALRLLHPREVDRENGIRIREGDHRFLIALKHAGGALIDWADRVSTRSADLILTNGEHVGRWIERVYGVSSQNCPAGCHPIPTAELEYSSRWNGVLPINAVQIPKPFLLLTNRHSPMKRFEYALWALKAIARSMPDASLVITGQETEYTDQLRYLVRGMRIERQVHFVGLVSEGDLGRLYREAAAYVYPSPEEDFGMGIVEAMAAGTPVVAWRSGGPTVTVVDGETGYLIEPYDTESFAQRLLSLLTVPTLAERLGRAGHLRARRAFTYQRHNAILERALSSALARAGQKLTHQPNEAEFAAEVAAIPSERHPRG